MLPGVSDGTTSKAIREAFFDIVSRLRLGFRPLIRLVLKGLNPEPPSWTLSPSAGGGGGLGGSGPESVGLELWVLGFLGWGLGLLVVVFFVGGGGGVGLFGAKFEGLGALGLALGFRPSSFRSCVGRAYCSVVVLCRDWVLGACRFPWLRALVQILMTL